MSSDPVDNRPPEEAQAFSTDGQFQQQQQHLQAEMPATSSHVSFPSSSPASAPISPSPAYTHTFVNGHLRITIPVLDNEGRAVMINGRPKTIIKTFNVTQGGSAGNHALIQKVINAQIQSGAMDRIVREILAADAHNASHAASHPSQGLKLVFTINETGLAVKRIIKATGTVSSTDNIAVGSLGAPESVAQRESVQRSSFAQLRQEVQLRTNMLAALKAAGLSQSIVEDTIDKIFGEGQLGLLGDVDNELADVTLTDLLQLPGNEVAFAALKGLRARATNLPPSYDVRRFHNEKKAMKLCKEMILDMLLMHVHRPPKVVRGTNHEMVQHMYQGTQAPRTPPLEPQNPRFLTAGAGPRALESMAEMATVNRGNPSEADKRVGRTPGLADHNINMGAVVARGDNGEESVVVVRSGKANTLTRAQELAKFALRQELDTGNNAALRPVRNENNTGQAAADGRRVFEYRPAINSHMDLGRAKRVSSAVGFAENEFQYTMSIARSIDEWPPEGYRVLTEITNDEGETEVVEVVIMRPVLSNQPLSSQVAGAGFTWDSTIDMGQNNADHFNGIANQQYLYDYLQDFAHLPQDDLEGLQTAARRLNRRLVETFGKPPETYLMEDTRQVGGVQSHNPLAGLIDFDKLKVKRFYDSGIFESREFQAYEAQVAKLLLTKLQNIQEKRASERSRARLATLQEAENMTIALYAIHFRRLPPESGTPEMSAVLSAIENGTFKTRPERSEEMHAADMEIYRHIACSPTATEGAVKKTKCKQCKSGVDRTGTDVALATAQERFRREHRYTFMPPRSIPVDESGRRVPSTDLLLFKKYFREALHEFAVSIVPETKGYSGLRVGEGASTFFGAQVNPVLHKYLFLQEDAPHLASIGLGGHQSDVRGHEDDTFFNSSIGLSYDDLERRGKHQYKGRLREPGAIYLQSEGSTRKKVAALQKQMKKHASFVKNEVRQALLAIGIPLHELPENIINNQFQLIVHISELNLDPEKIRRLKAQIASRVNPSGDSEAAVKARLVTKTLNRILAIAERAAHVANVERFADGTPQQRRALLASGAISSPTLSDDRLTTDLATMNAVSAAEDSDEEENELGSQRDAPVARAQAERAQAPRSDDALEAEIDRIIRYAYPNTYENEIRDNFTASELQTLERILPKKQLLARGKDLFRKLDKFKDVLDAMLAMERVASLARSQDRAAAASGAQLPGDLGIRVAQWKMLTPGAMKAALESDTLSLGQRIELYKHLPGMIAATNGQEKSKLEHLQGVLKLVMLEKGEFPPQQVQTRVTQLLALSGAALKGAVESLSPADRLELQRWLPQMIRMKEGLPDPDGVVVKYRGIISVLTEVAFTMASRELLAQIKTLHATQDGADTIYTAQLLMMHNEALIPTKDLFELILNEFTKAGSRLTTDEKTILMGFCVRWVEANRDTTQFDVAVPVLRQIAAHGTAHESGSAQRSAAQLTRLLPPLIPAAVPAAAPAVRTPPAPAVAEEADDFKTILSGLYGTRFGGDAAYARNVRKIAADFSAMQAAQRAIIYPQDLVRSKWAGGESPVVKNYRDFLLQMTNFVSRQIQAEPDPVKQRRLIKFFINIGATCLENGDQASAKAIYNALQQLNGLPAQSALDEAKRKYSESWSQLSRLQNVDVLPSLAVPQDAPTLQGERYNIGVLTQMAASAKASLGRDVKFFDLFARRTPPELTTNFFVGIDAMPALNASDVVEVHRMRAALISNPDNAATQLMTVTDLRLLEGVRVDFATLQAANKALIEDLDKRVSTRRSTVYGAGFLGVGEQNAETDAELVRLQGLYRIAQSEKTKLEGIIAAIEARQEALRPLHPSPAASPPPPSPPAPASPPVA